MCSALATAAASSQAQEGASSLPTSPPSPPATTTSDAEYDQVSERMQEEEKKMRQASKVQEAQYREAGRKEVEKIGVEKFDAKLNFLLSRSKIFASIVQKKFEAQTLAKDENERKEAAKRKTDSEKAAIESQRRATRASATTTTGTKPAKTSKSQNLPTRGKRKKNDGDITAHMKQEDLEAKCGGKSIAQAIQQEVEDYNVKPTSLGAQDLRSTNQPVLVSGGIMRTYQLEGLTWLATLYENGLNGILADEMGLGKTVQTISFLAYLRERGVYGPFLVVAPLSTLSNWVEEFARWTPDIPVVLYHGTPTERAEVRKKQLKHPGEDTFPVVCTSYEVCMNDQKYLSQYEWNYVIVDEGHRLKNLNCKLIRELKKYPSANRLLITGTPLQNNLAELWSLLNFLLPQIFDSFDNFEGYFDFSAVLEKDGQEQIIKREKQNSTIVSLHAILKPFLLRRVKTDVESSLPKKREYILYAPLTTEQKELYREIKEGNSRAYLEQKAVERIINEEKGSAKSSRSSSLKRKAVSEFSTPSKSAKSSRASTPASSIRSSRKGKRSHNYKEVSDREYFQHLEDSSSSEELDEEEREDLERARTIALAKKEIAQKKLQNPIMQLRLACNSPHNFYWPFSSTPDHTLTTASGKLLLLDRLVPHLLANSHKLLIFSQFKITLDILEDWCTELHHWPCCRIDGGVKQEDRRRQIKLFNTDKKYSIFLLSTRAGGQGINLAAADTVILFDSDWNPQQDLQAQDRAHRIGQTRPVIVYRLATKGTIEQTLLEKADGKRRLEKLVIRKGKFRSLLSNREGEEDDDLRKVLEEDDFEKYDVGESEEILSDKDLEILTDRSEAAYVRAAKGEEGVESGKFKAVETKREEGILGGVGG